MAIRDLQVDLLQDFILTEGLFEYQEVLYTIPAVANYPDKNPIYFVVWLDEAPFLQNRVSYPFVVKRASDNFLFTEVTNYPNQSGTFCVAPVGSLRANAVIFHGDDAGVQVKINYWGYGSIIRSDTFLQKEQNLADIPDISSARNNLDVFSREEVNFKYKYGVGRPISTLLYGPDSNFKNVISITNGEAGHCYFVNGGNNRIYKINVNKDTFSPYSAPILLNWTPAGTIVNICYTPNFLWVVDGATLKKINLTNLQATTITTSVRDIVGGILANTYHSSNPIYYIYYTNTSGHLLAYNTDTGTITTIYNNSSIAQWLYCTIDGYGCFYRNPSSSSFLLGRGVTTGGINYNLSATYGYKMCYVGNGNIASFGSDGNNVYFFNILGSTTPLIFNIGGSGITAIGKTFLPNTILLTNNIGEFWLWRFMD